MAYTKEENEQPARYLGVVRARDKADSFSIWEQKAKSKKLNKESKQIDKTSIYQERLDRHQAVENKKKQSKADKCKREQKRIDSDRPYHRLEWQFKSTVGCQMHKLRLLSKCPSCGEPFPTPAE